MRQRLATIPVTNSLSPPPSAAACCAPETTPLLQVQNLSLRYHGKLALDQVNINLAAGGVTALIGPSGCGKSSFLACLNRLSELIPGCRVEGRVLLNGEDIYRREQDLTELRRRIGMVFQRANPFPLSIRRNLELPLREAGLRNKSELDGRIESALKAVGLWAEVADRLASPAQALSGGQQQRLCIARALTLEPELLLMDEPCSALDPISSGVVEDLIQSFKGRYTVLVVTHNLAQARRISDRCGVFWLRDGVGRLIECADTHCLFACPSDADTAAYLSGARG